MANNAQIAADVLAAVGGKENVSSVTHCMTRLRFILKDAGVPKDDEVKKIKCVIGVAKAGGQYQVIIGQNVAKVYDEVCKLGGFAASAAIDENLDKEKPKEKLTAKKIGSNIMNYLSGSMTPLLPIMLAAGMFKTIIVVLDRRCSICCRQTAACTSCSISCMTQASTSCPSSSATMLRKKLVQRLHSVCIWEQF